MVGKKAQPWHHIQHPLISQKPHRKVAFLWIDLHICIRYVDFSEIMPKTYKKGPLEKGKKTTTQTIPINFWVPAVRYINL